MMWIKNFRRRIVWYCNIKMYIFDCFVSNPQMKERNQEKASEN